LTDADSLYGEKNSAALNPSGLAMIMPGTL
jgi:hypothetical protein